MQKLQKEIHSHQHRTRQLEEDMELNRVQTMQTISAREEETSGVLKVQMRDMQQQLRALSPASMRLNLVIHAPADCGHQQLLDQCNTTLQAAAPRSKSIPTSALHSMRTQGTAHSLWRLQLDTEQTKHALFARSKDFRRQHIFLDDELTRQQQQGRRALASERLRLKGLGHRTWWRRDRLFWADADGVHSQIPAST